MSGNNVTRPEEARRLVREAAAAGFDHIKVFEGLTPEVFSAKGRDGNTEFLIGARRGP